LEKINGARARDVIAPAALILSIFNSYWQYEVHVQSQTIPAKLVMEEIGPIEIGLYRYEHDYSITSTAKFSARLFVVTTHEFRLTVSDGKFEWLDVTETLGKSYASLDQGVGLLITNPAGWIAKDSGDITLDISVFWTFKTNQTAFRQWSRIPVGKFQFTIEYVDLKTDHKIAERYMTGVALLIGK
jgi:hypothetical protein